MSRPKGLIRRISKNISLPQSLVVRMELDLFSEVDGRIPIGAQSTFIESLLRKHYEQLDAIAVQAKGEL